MIALVNITALAAKAAGPIAKKAAEAVVLACVTKLAGKAVEHAVKPKAVPKAEPAKTTNDAIVNVIVQDFVALGFACATEFAVGSIRNHLAKQAQ